MNDYGRNGGNRNGNRNGGRQSARRKPETVTDRIKGRINEKISGIATLPERAAAGAVKRWKQLKAAIGSVSIDKRDIYRALICTGLILFAALTETTFFGRFHPFGATPDLMLPLIIAIGMTEGGTWGGAFGIVGGVVIDSLGSVRMTLTPIVFMLAGFFAGLLLEEYFSDTPAVRGIMIGGGVVLRAVMTLVSAASEIPDFNLGAAFRLVIGPELLATLVISPLMHLAAFLSLRWAHKSRTEQME